MKILRMDHVGVTVNDLSAAKEFFLDLGLEVQGEWEKQMEGEWMDQVIGQNNVKVASVGLGMPDGQAWIELIKYDSPSDDREIQQPLVNTQSIRHIAFAVEDIEAVVAKLKKKGTEFFGEIQHYEESYKLCYCRGPEGIIVELAEQIK
ncbi:VOC family protein [Neobacillus sp. OS1-2]|uniref:VOC family protein n=1 Tax=Neobacillus sp. OS1-2 TaxID=3070680 RepID=UPI0027E16BE2|nr:VOC family protein [Neobacillus sp. OS1-2]WML39581.1 VOC family protein [Neobacillus sp. OS1-2]